MSLFGDTSVGDGPYSRNTNFVVLLQNGRGFRKSDYDPTLPNNTVNSQFNFSRLINDIPLITAVQNGTTGRRLDTAYKNLVVNARGHDTAINPDENQRLQNAKRFLHRYDENNNKIGDTEVYTTYKKAKAAFDKAKGSFLQQKLTDLSRPNGDVLWENEASSYQDNIDNALEEFNAANRNEVDNARAIESQFGRNVLTDWFADLNSAYDKQVHNDERGSWQTSIPDPSNWYDPDVESENKILVDSSSLVTTDHSSFESFGGGASFDLGFFQLQQMQVLQYMINTTM